ncbi:MAG: hypothetical protein MI673_00135, partial [Thiotrichales bacterium]|nr:hypothetical protein [Thiotrichales bacterium]
MSSVFSLLVFIATVLFGSALLAWPLQQYVLPDYPLHKLLGHLTLILGLIGSFVFLYLNGLLSRRGCGYDIGKKTFLLQAGIGLVVGNGILLSIELLLMVLGIHQIEP